MHEFTGSNGTQAMADDPEALTASGSNSNPIARKSAINWGRPVNDWGLSSKAVD